VDIARHTSPFRKRRRVAELRRLRRLCRDVRLKKEWDACAEVFVHIHKDYVPGANYNTLWPDVMFGVYVGRAGYLHDAWQRRAHTWAMKRRGDELHMVNTYRLLVAGGVSGRVAFDVALCGFDGLQAWALGGAWWLANLRHCKATYPPLEQGAHYAETQLAA
jgi:hypothetical protein